MWTAAVRQRRETSGRHTRGNRIGLTYDALVVVAAGAPARRVNVPAVPGHGQVVGVGQIVALSTLLRGLVVGFDVAKLPDRQTAHARVVGQRRGVHRHQVALPRASGGGGRVHGSGHTTAGWRGGTHLVVLRPEDTREGSRVVAPLPDAATTRLADGEGLVRPVGDDPVDLIRPEGDGVRHVVGVVVPPAPQPR